MFKKPNLISSIIAVLLGLIVGLFAAAITYFAYGFSNLLFILATTFIGSLIGYLFYINLPYETNLKWARYTNRTGISASEFADLRRRSLLYLAISGVIEIYMRQARLTPPLWLIPVGGGIVIGVSLGILVFALKNREAILGIKKQDVLSSTKPGNQGAYLRKKNNYLS